MENLDGYGEYYSFKFENYKMRGMSLFLAVILLLGASQLPAEQSGINSDHKAVSGSTNSADEGFYGGLLIGLVLSVSGLGYVLLFIPSRRSPSSGEPAKKEKPDHSLACAVSDAIERINFRLRKMEESDGNRESIVRMLERLDRVLESRDYKRIEIYGRQYDDGMTCKPQFVESDDPAHAKATIVRVIKAQVHFKGRLVQRPEIQVGRYYGTSSRPNEA